MKPQSSAKLLDGRDRSPHRSAMAAKDKPDWPAPNSKEAKLAQALRANLRRRKARSSANPAQEEDGKS